MDRFDRDGAVTGIITSSIRRRHGVWRDKTIVSTEGRHADEIDPQLTCLMLVSRCHGLVVVIDHVSFPIELGPEHNVLLFKTFRFFTGEMTLSVISSKVSNITGDILNVTPT